MATTRLASVAVVTVSYNSGHHLAQFLESIRSSETFPMHIVVADNGSVDMDELVEITSRHDSTLLPLSHNFGYGGAINRAVKTLPPSVTSILIANPDVQFTERSISSLVGALDSSPVTAATGPRIMNSDGSVYPSARSLPSLRTGVGHAIFGQIWPQNRWTKRYLSDAYHSQESRSVGWLSGACMLVDRERFESIGGFDEEYFMYFEDVDLGYRLGKAGWACVYVPAAAVFHAGAHSTSTESGRMLRVHHRSAYHYLQKKYSSPLLAPVRAVLWLGLSVRSVYVGSKADRLSRRRSRSEAV
jgi:N-acetylglucosaminyl-diphospho-decaprenol L-rhamnosyltransferase